MFKSLIYLLLLWETTRFLEMISFFDFFFLPPGCSLSPREDLEG